MIWVKFIALAAVIVVAANFLAKYGDVIAIRTGLGGMFIGVLLLAGATSLPEVLTSISAVNQGTPNIAAGNLLGSNSFNMLLLAVLDLLNRRARLLRTAARRHALSGSLAILMIALVLYFLLADIETKVLWVGLDSLIIVAVYIIAVRFISSEGQPDKASEKVVPEGTAKLWVGIAGFLAAAGVLILVTPALVSTSTEIAEVTGLGTTFVGTTLVALVTSLPMMWAVAVFFGIAYGLSQAIYFALAMKYTQPAIAASMYSILMAVTNIGQGIGLGLSGGLAKSAGYPVTFLVFGALMLLVIPFLPVIFGKRTAR